MRNHIRKWGNRLALRIPKSLAAQAGLHDDSLVEVSLIKGKINIAPVARSAPTCHQLLARITRGNKHYAVDTGAVAGIEAW